MSTRGTRLGTPRPGDTTAIQKQALEKEHEAELAERAHELSMAAQVQADDDRRDTVHDYFSQADQALPESRAEEDQASPFREVRINSTIDQMAYGVEIRTERYTDENGVERELEVPGGVRYFDFEEGKQYRLPRHMADYLDSKGYVVR